MRAGARRVRQFLDDPVDFKTRIKQSINARKKEEKHNMDVEWKIVPVEPIVDTREKLIAAHKDDKLVSVKWPGSGDMAISLERHMIDNAMTEWCKLETLDRLTRMQSVRRSIKRTTKRLKKNRATQTEVDDLAADIALFIGHELAYGDGEKYLIKGPGLDDFKKSVEQ